MTTCDMQIRNDDRNTLRALAEEYSEIAHLDVQRERTNRYFQTNALETVKPVVLINEIPWGEIRDPDLINTCDPSLEWIETHLRTTIYQWKHFQVDRVVPSVFGVGKRIKWLQGIGLEVKDNQIQSTTGAYISAHAYTDQLQTEDDLAKLHNPRLEYDKTASETALAVASEIFDGLMKTGLRGMDGLHANIWDRIAMYRGVDNLLLDLAERPEFMHKTARIFTEISKSEFAQIEQQELLDPQNTLLHCTTACARELPAPDCDGHIRQKDVWGRCAAQIFGSVSPSMHDEFDLAYNQELFRDSGLVYYGCCEPMDRKIDILRKRFTNLRKVSITPWADPMRAAEQIGRDYVMAAKPNPAFVASEKFNPEPVTAEIARYCEACLKHGTTLEFVLKDISTIANRPENLTLWAETVNTVISRYYP